MPSFSKQPNVRLWKFLTLFFLLLSLGLLIGLIVVKQQNNNNDDDDNDNHSDGLKTCGSAGAGTDDLIDMSEPAIPGPFHDLTEAELLALRTFLEKDSTTRAFSGPFAGMDQSVIHMADLYLPPKAAALRYLDMRGAQPPRQARVMMLRGDLATPQVEEYICGPLPEVTKCELMKLLGRRNPAQFSLRPFTGTEFYFISSFMVPQIEKELGYILEESYGTTYTKCDEQGLCLGIQPSPVGTSLFGDISRRKMWCGAVYSVEQRSLHQVDFGFLLDLTGKDATSWSIEGIWYGGIFYKTMDELITKYNASSITKTKVTKPNIGDDLFSRMTLKGDPWPNPTKRPPKLVEPDGKRYTLKNRKVEYMDWTFNFRLSPFSGPALNDVRFKGERIVYDMGLQELSVFYSGFSPLVQTTDYMDTAALLGTNSRALVPGGDCPDTATFISQTFMAQYITKTTKFKRAMCLFEGNDGFPLRRHMTHSKGLGAVYTGMLNTALTLRAAMTIGNYDYIIDYIFHQSGALETRWMSSGYILSNLYTDKEKDYSFHLHGFRGGPLHHHLAHFRVDLDVSGTSNRYETLDIVPQDVPLTMDPSVRNFQTAKFQRSLKETELDAVYHYNFEKPKLHVFHNEKVVNQNGQMKAYRIDITGMSKQVRYKKVYNEVVIPWARNQMAVTRHKDSEFWSTSSYAMWDSADPVMDFSDFYDNNENITDQDLVAWISLGVHHLPRTEDLPVTTTLGNHRGFYIMPFNYFPQCPSMRSRDAIRMTHKNPAKPEDGIKLELNGDPEGQCITPKQELRKEVEDDPDGFLETKDIVPIF